MYDKDYVKIVY